MNIKTSIKKYSDRYAGKAWFWYAVVGIIAAISYPSIVGLLTKQFSFYQIHVGNPAVYIAFLVMYAVWFDKLYRRKWGKGKMGIMGNVLLFAGAMVIVVFLVYVFDYKFLWLSKGG